MLFIDASREFKAGKNQNQLSEENIKKIVKTYRDGDNVEKYAYLASLKEIQDNDYNLNIPRYVDTFEEEDEIDLLVVRKEREQLKGKRAARTVLTGMCYSFGNATRQGSSSLTRFIGQSAITSSTWRR